MLICFHMVWGGFCTMTAKLRSCYRDSMTHKAKNYLQSECCRLNVHPQMECSYVAALTPNLIVFVGGALKITTFKWVMRVGLSRWDSVFIRRERTRATPTPVGKHKKGNHLWARKRSLTKNLSMFTPWPQTSACEVCLSHTVYYIWWWKPKLTKTLALHRKSQPQLQSCLIDWVLST